jgi:UDP-N-acetylglucosamine/UDP-N-acetylgalactosamine 4-epimerase
MNVLVTGGAGFIGSHLVQALLERGDAVTVLDNFSTGKRENLAPFAERIRLVEGDVADMSACLDAMHGVDTVLHQAALGSVPRSVADPAGTHEANLTGTLNALVAARASGVQRFVYAGSSSAYGDTETLPKREDMLPRPLSPYAVSKLAGEHYCAAFHATFGMQTITLRYFNVFGPRQDPHSQYAAVIPRFIAAALAGAAPAIYGDGEQSRDFTYIDNVVQANLLACTAPTEAGGMVFNTGGGQQTTVNRLWRMIRELTGASTEPSHSPPRAGDVRHSLASIERAQQVLGYRPAIGIEEGLRRTVASYGPHASSSG